MQFIRSLLILTLFMSFYTSPMENNSRFARSNKFFQRVGARELVAYKTIGRQIASIIRCTGESKELTQFNSTVFDVQEEVVLFTNFHRNVLWRNKGYEEPFLRGLCNKIFQDPQIRCIAAYVRVYDPNIQTDYEQCCENKNYAAILAACGFKSSSNIDAFNPTMYVYKEAPQRFNVIVNEAKNERVAQASTGYID